MGRSRRSEGARSYEQKSTSTTRNSGSKTPIPIGKRSGVVTLGKKMLRQKKQTDVQKKDPKLLAEAMVRIVRDSRIEALAARTPRSNKQRKKQPVNKPSVVRPRSATIYKAKKKQSIRQLTPHQPNEIPLAPFSIRKAAAKAKIALSHTYEVPQEKQSFNATPKLKSKTSIKKSKYSIKRLSKKGPRGLKSTKSPVFPGKKKLKPQRKVYKKRNVKPSVVKKLTLPIPRHLVLLTLIRKFDIQLTRDVQLDIMSLRFNEDNEKEEIIMKHINGELLDCVMDVEFEIAGVGEEVDASADDTSHEKSYQENDQDRTETVEDVIMLVDETEFQPEKSDTLGVEPGLNQLPSERSEEKEEVTGSLAEEAISFYMEEEEELVNEVEEEVLATTVNEVERIDSYVTTHGLNSQENEGEEDSVENGGESITDEDLLSLNESTIEIPINYGNQIRNALAASDAKQKLPKLTATVSPTQSDKSQ